MPGYRVNSSGSNNFTAGNGVVEFAIAQPIAGEEIQIFDSTGLMSVKTIPGGVRLLPPMDSNAGVHEGAAVHKLNGVLDITESIGPHDVASIPIDEKASYWIRATVQGFEDTNAMANFYVVFAGVYRTTGSAPTIQGITPLVTIETNPECSVTFVTSGNNVVLRIESTENFAETVWWTWLLEFQKAGNL